MNTRRKFLGYIGSLLLVPFVPDLKATKIVADSKWGEAIEGSVVRRVRLGVGIGLDEAGEANFKMFRAALWVPPQYQTGEKSDEMLCRRTIEEPDKDFYRGCWSIWYPLNRAMEYGFFDFKGDHPKAVEAIDGMRSDLLERLRLETDARGTFSYSIA